MQIARSLDLNDLHALSRTCRQMHSNLLQFRQSLVSCTMRCVNDSVASPPAADLALLRIQDPARSIRTRLTSGRVGPCAADLVAACQRCGDHVCRNCIMRLQSSRLPQRLRRLCATCSKAPLDRLAGLPGNGGDNEAHPALPVVTSFTTPAFARGACMCPEGAFICRPCGHELPSSDSTYRLIWNWRRRYSREGIGTGIGEGTEGVKCARGAACLAMQEIEVEVDCDQEVHADDGNDSAPSTEPGPETHGTIASGDSSAVSTPTQEHRADAGYMRQEIEGIGGGLRGKVKKRKRVGHPVREFEDEREQAGFLLRESCGDRRGWCGWCERVVPDKHDSKANAYWLQVK